MATLFSALVADHAPAELRGAAFGAFNLAAVLTVIGILLLAARLRAAG